MIVASSVRARIPLLLAALLAGDGGATARASPGPGAPVAAGDAALSGFDLPRAAAAYRAARAADPGDYEAAWKLARALADAATLTADAREAAALGAEAAALAREAVRLAPGRAEGHTVLAVALGRLALAAGGRHKVELAKEVRAEADLALAADPRDDVAHHVLGVWHREMAGLNPLLRAFAALLYGRFPPASVEEAVAQLRRAAALRPDAVAHHVELGVTLAAAGRRDEGCAELETGLALPDGWVTDPHYRALARRAIGRLCGRR